MRRIRHTCFANRARRFESLEPRQLLAADVVISEIMYHPASDNSAHEYIELHNRGDVDIDLAGWRIANGVDFVFPPATLPSDGYVVVAADLTEFRAIYGNEPLALGGWTGRLANRGETITLDDATGARIDRVRFADEGEWSQRFLGEPDAGFSGWKWDSPHDGKGQSLELVNAGLPNEFGFNWDASDSEGGTPGRANSVATADGAPIATNVRHSPPIPDSTQAVTIYADVVDEQAGVAVTLNYRFGATAFTQQPMLPVDAGHSVGETTTYAATIDAASNGTIVEFFVAATDTGGQTRVTPDVAAHPARTANYLYQVLDDAPDSDHWNPNSNDQPMTYLVMREQERALLQDIGDGPLVEAESNAAMNATLIRVDGNGTDVRYNVSVRNRGGASRIGPPNNYRINIPHDQPWDGAVSVNLNSRFVHAQIIGSAIFRLAGLPAAEATPAQVRVNGQDLAEPDGPLMFGSYAQLETITGSFPDKYFRDDRRGNLYRAVAAGTDNADLRYRGPDAEAYQDVYSKRTNEEENDWSDLIEMTRVLTESPDEQFVDQVGQVIDIDQWLRFVALDSLLGNRETGLALGTGDNYWLYRGQVDRRFKIIPHDLDTILGRARVGEPNRSIFEYTAVPGLSRLLTHPEIVPRYYSAYLDLIAELYNPETLHPLMDQILGGFVATDELTEMKQFVVDRIDGVLAQLPREFAITSDLPTTNGIHRTTIPAAELVGTADAVRTQRVEVNGELAEWSPLTREWSIRTTSDGESTTLVSFGAEWAFLDDGTNQGSAWRQTGFDSTDWSSGPAPLGYGNGDEGTVVGFGGNANNKYVTTYFRHEFPLEDRNAVRDLTLRLQRDDGAIVYLNGQEIVRSNMPAGEIDHQTVASTWIGGGLEQQVESFSVDPALLLSGKNVLAVEIHQRSPIDDDIRLDLSLEATVGAIEGGIQLFPGINRIEVATFGDAAEPFARDFLDIWYDGAIGQDAATCESYATYGQMAPTVINGGTLDRDTVLAPCGPAYRVTGELVVPDGVTLTVMPGTSLFFEEDAGLIVAGGRLVADGNPFEPIRFSRRPASNASWRGVQFVDAMTDNRVSHAIIEHAATADGMVGLQSSELTIDSVTFEDTDRYRIRTVDSSLIVRNSTFADIFADDQPPTTDNRSEHIWGSGIAAGGQLLIQNNYFGTTKGHNDAIDFDGAALPGPIPIIENNFFAGTGDDAVDLETDALIVGNTFVNVVKDEFNTSTGDANAISAGAGRNYFASRNVFANVDHAVQVKDDAFLTFENNTVSRTHLSAIYFDLEDRSPGKGAVVRDSIFDQTPITFGAVEQAEVVTIHNSIVEDGAGAMGNGNLVGDPRFVRDENDFRLRKSSPAVASGTNGIDRGGLVDGTLQLVGVPETITSSRTATFEVYGPGMDAYRYRLNDGPWSDPLPVTTPVLLTDLAMGDHQIEFSGRDYAGRWQTSDAFARATWTVAPSATGVRINEILARNRAAFEQDGVFPDAIELFNSSNTAIDLSGMRLTDNLADSARFVFPAGSIIAPQDYFVITNADSDVSLGFRLNGEGESVYLLGAQGTLIDSVTFGLQAADYSIGRTGPDAQWQLTRPSLGAMNELQTTGDLALLRINEWLAGSIVQFNDDFVELYNADTLPVELSGIYVTDDPVARPQQHVVAPLSYIGPQDFAVFYADENTTNGPNHLPFRLNAAGELLAVRAPSGDLIDQVLYFEQTDDWSQGRAPDGTDDLTFQRVVTPGSANIVIESNSRQLIDWDQPWAFEQSPVNFSESWNQPGHDDSNWQRGDGTFAVGANQLPVGIGTELEGGHLSSYFRTTFDVSADYFDPATAVAFDLELLVDDGAAVYLNGSEIVRVGLPDGDLTPTTRANRGVSNAVIEGPFSVPATLFKPGSNLLTVELHQISPASADAVFGLSLDATTTRVDAEVTRATELLAGLRISEVMYHPADDAELEFIELTNISAASLDVSGVRLQGGIDFEFASHVETTLAPQEYVVIARNRTLFSRVHPGIRVVGEFRGRLSNNSDRVRLMLPQPFTGAIVDFTYDDDWYPTTDGDGRSLVVVDEYSAPRALRNTAGWESSNELGGSPGRGESSAADFNGDGAIDLHDVDLLCSALQAQTGDERLDLNGDQAIDDRDLAFMIDSVLATRVGDVNLDGRFDSADLVLIFQTGLYEDNISGNATWSVGDWNCDGEFDSTDLVFAFQAGGYSP